MQSPHAPETNALDALTKALEKDSKASRELLANLQENRICSVFVDDSIPCVYVVWKGYASSIQLRFIHESILDLLRQHTLTKLFGDDRALAPIRVADEEWISESWIPRAITAGLKVVANIRPTGVFAKFSVDRIQSSLPKTVAVRSFQGHADGLEWLREQA